MRSRRGTSTVFSELGQSVPRSYLNNRIELGRKWNFSRVMNEIPVSSVFVGKVLMRSLKVACVVGTVLIAINQGDRILAGEGVDWFKAILTYMVPFCVATYGAWSALRDRD